MRKGLYTVCFSEAFGGHWDFCFFGFHFFQSGLVEEQAAFGTADYSMNYSLVWNLGVRVRPSSEARVESPRQQCA